MTAADDGNGMNLQLRTFGEDVASTSIELAARDAASRRRESQTWVRLAPGWRIVSAHAGEDPVERLGI
jgi:hypothetical protein